MGLFDDLFSGFTGEPQQQAAADQRQFLGNLYGGLSHDIGNAVDLGRQMVEYGKDNTTSALQGGFNAARNALNTGTQQGINTLESAYGNNYRDTAGLSADAMGLNGPAGTARAQAAFTTGPGYEFALEQGLNSVARGANAAGMVASGNQLQESQRYGQGLANQEYNNWLGGVRQREALYAPLYGRGVADLQAQGGRNLASLESQAGIAQGGVYDTFAQRSSQLPMQGVGLQANLGGALARDYSNSYMNAANAQTQGNANMWNGIGNVLGSNAFGNAVTGAFDFIF